MKAKRLFYGNTMKTQKTKKFSSVETTRSVRTQDNISFKLKSITLKNSSLYLYQTQVFKRISIIYKE